MCCMEIKTLSYDSISDIAEDLIKAAEITVPEDTKSALNEAAAKETNETAKQQLLSILENIKIAQCKKIPVCQDTGIFIFYVTIGRDIHLSFDIEKAIRDGTVRATKTVPLRPNTVDPLTRKNTKTNTGFGLPDVQFEFEEGRNLTIELSVKGAGSENMSSLRMFRPTEKHLIPKFVAQTVLNAGGKPCPPIILGIGIGGSFDKAARLSKKALVEPLLKKEDMSELERKIFDDVNALGIGCMGLGGDTTVLSVRVKQADCHTASLPVAINIQCWANRHQKAVYRGH